MCSMPLESLSHQTMQVSPTIPPYVHLCVYASDFNCQHTDWDYTTNSPDGVCLVNWVNKNAPDQKDTPSFYYDHWNSETNPRLSFLSLGQNNNRFHNKCVQKKFPRSQH